MIVRFELRRRNGSRQTLTVSRRPDWLPPQTYRESHITPHFVGHLDYRLDTRASAERSVPVYRQVREH